MPLIVRARERAADVVALAYDHFHFVPFSGCGLAKLLLLPKTSGLTITALSNINLALSEAAALGWLETDYSSQHGTIWRVTPSGLAAIQANRLKLWAERPSIKADDDQVHFQSQDNPGPMLQQLWLKVDDECRFNARSIIMRNWVEGVWSRWITVGSLSLIDARRLATIGMTHGILIIPEKIAGTAPPEWRQRFMGSFIASKQQSHQKNITAISARREFLLRQSEQRRLQRANGTQVAAMLNNMLQGENLAKIEALVAAAFPAVRLTPRGLTAAIRGGGNRCLRTCITALAFGCPPSKIWHTAHPTQPDENSTEWQMLISQPMTGAFCPLIEDTNIAHIFPKRLAAQSPKA